MVKVGINLIPDMPVQEVIDTAIAAEEIGYDYFILADEGFMQDVYILLGAIARDTQRIKLSPCTNGYTRHPAVTAAAMASLNELSDGRGFLTLIAGGSLVLNPMNIKREAPLTVLHDTVQILRSLWSGEKVSIQGKRLSISNAQITPERSNDIPIWIAPRGEKMCQLAGEIGDAAMMMVKADLGEGFSLLEQGSRIRGNQPKRVFLDRMACTPEMIDETTAFFPNIIVDTPARQLRKFMQEDQIEAIRNSIKEGGAEAAKKYVSIEMLKGYKIAGTPAECSQIIRSLVEEHQLDAYVLNLVSGGFDNNLKHMSDVYQIIRDSGCLVE
jgi:5,10-methylenetetrahydromethanopterin reductase